VDIRRPSVRQRTSKERGKEQHVTEGQEDECRRRVERPPARLHVEHRRDERDDEAPDQDEGTEGYAGDADLAVQTRPDAASNACSTSSSRPVRPCIAGDKADATSS
jgi:hypothetical protein